MSRTLTACRTGLSVAAAVVLLTACGGSDDQSSASSSSSGSSSSASETSAANSEFCTEAERALQGVEPAFSGGGDDPAALATALQDAADQVRTIDPPSEIEADWTALADGIEQFAQAFAAVNPNDPASAAELQQRTSEILGSLSTSATNVQNYLASECGIETDSPEPSAPTS
jgi:membrane-bound lytic murein transglycosylase B